MSSLLGHISVGVAAYLSCNRLSDLRALRTMPLFVLLAVCPDFDYFAVWLLHYSAAPRITHTLLFALASSLAAWWCSTSWREAGVAHLPFWALAAASASHPLLDLLVGAHPLPLLWPLASPDIAIAFGVLPSAGQLRIGNYYLWRNLLIELAILLPALALMVAVARRCPTLTIARAAMLIAPVWLAFAAWSFGLQR